MILLVYPFLLFPLKRNPRIQWVVIHAMLRLYLIIISVTKSMHLKHILEILFPIYCCKKSWNADNGAIVQILMKLILQWKRCGKA